MPRRHPTLYLALFLSGASALVYESAWGRMLHRVFGVGDLAVATVLGAFFLGMGLGAALGGRLAHRLHRPALAYAALEVVIGVWAMASLGIIPRVHDLYRAVGADAGFGALTALRLALALLILLPPTVLMGATLPILVAAVARRDASWSDLATELYATNTLGAVLGAGATGLYLLAEVGTRATMMVAAFGSFAAATIVGLAWRHPEEARLTRVAGEVPGPRPEVTRRARVAAAAAGTAGIAALAGEVLWTRVLRTIVQGTSQAFAAMLVDYLLGIALGSLVASRIIRRGSNPARAFASVQLGLVGATLAAMALTPHLPRLLALVEGSAELVPNEVQAILLLASFLLLPLAILLGTSVPLAWAMADEEPTTAARHTGRVLAANTFGGLAGALAGGFLLVPLLPGIERSLVVVAGLHALTASIVFAGTARSLRRRVAGALGPLALAALLPFAHPAIPLPYLLDAWSDADRAIIEGPTDAWSEPVVFLEEGRNTTVSVLERGDNLRLFNDGRPESGFGPDQPGFGAELVLLGALPTLLADTPERALVVGLGAGHVPTVLLAGPYAEVVVVELEEAVVRAARVMHERRGAAFPLDDPRARLIVDDARAQLALAGTERYDVIVSQPSHPWLAGTSDLYTEEFFAEAQRALRPGGVVAIWVNLFRMDAPRLRQVIATLDSVFLHVIGFVAEESSFLLVAGDRPLWLDARVQDRLEEDARLESYLRPFSLHSVEELVAVQELDAAGARATSAGVQPLVDDRPSLEFDLARLPFSSELTVQALDAAFARIRWLAPESVAALPADTRVLAFLWRIDQLWSRPGALDRLEASLEGTALTTPELRLVRGALAEARGELDEALRLYDASDTYDGDYRAERLRLDEGRHAELLDAVERRGRVAGSPDPALRSALAMGDPASAARALRLTAGASEPGDPALLAATQSWARGDCPAVRATLAELTTPVSSPELAFLGVRCSVAGGDLEAARTFADRRAELRVALSAEATEAAAHALEGGNRGGAEPLLRRALRAHAGNAHAAAQLARIEHERGRDRAAWELLRATRTAAAGRAGALRELDEAASSLGLSLDGPPPAEPGANAAGASSE